MRKLSRNPRKTNKQSLYSMSESKRATKVTCPHLLCIPGVLALAPSPKGHRVCAGHRLTLGMSTLLCTAGRQLVLPGVEQNGPYFLLWPQTGPVYCIQQIFAVHIPCDDRALDLLGTSLR